MSIAHSLKRVRVPVVDEVLRWLCFTNQDAVLSSCTPMLVQLDTGGNIAEASLQIQRMPQFWDVIVECIQD